MKTLRRWIKTLENAGALTRIGKVVDMRYVSALAFKERHEKGNATLFEKIRGYDIPLVVNAISDVKMVALALETDEKNVQQEYGKRVSHLVKPRLVKDGPVKEVVHVGNDVDLTKFPIPLQHADDGAPYISAGITVDKNPDTGESNLGMYRNMFRTKNELGIDLVSATKTSVFYRKACEKGKSFQVAIVIGSHPLDMIASIAPDKDLEVMGALRREPVELIKCETVDLAVPKDAEIVLEGELLPNRIEKSGKPYEAWTTPEGPYGEAHKYMSYRGRNPVIRLRAITHRKNPIFQTVTIGTKFAHETDTTWIFAPGTTYWLAHGLKRMGFDVRGIRISGVGFHVTISIKKWFEGQGRNVILALFNMGMFKNVVVVDEDIDVNNSYEVDWAVATRVQPEKDVIIVSELVAKPYDPSLYPNAPSVTTSKMGVDATKPLVTETSRFRIAKLPYEKEVLR